MNEVYTFSAMTCNEWVKENNQPTKQHRKPNKQTSAKQISQHQPN